MILISDPERKNELLSKLAKDKDMKAFLDACYRWSLEPQVWQDFELLNYPPATREWQEFEQLDYKDRGKLDASFFFQPAIREYMIERQKAYAHNSAIFSWLKDMKAFFPDTKDNLEIHIKLDEKIYEFTHWFNSNLQEVKKTFNAQEAN